MGLGLGVVQRLLPWFFPSEMIRHGLGMGLGSGVVQRLGPGQGVVPRPGMGLGPGLGVVVLRHMLRVILSLVQQLGTLRSSLGLGLVGFG